MNAELAAIVCQREVGVCTAAAS